ncbi:hypothetical protein CC86DRAFT_57494 [Ophiobolus disseminans]|uniref:Uncharacterized protein n=1 Tax=Ophiobolus disseminans TaxID=1469910 RepID=A0A6A6ZS59_9PLEO|nr:hypothetical protein CC86DRAFT_57494 [Ophiobolus disseminans]
MEVIISVDAYQSLLIVEALRFGNPRQFDMQYYRTMKKLGKKIKSDVPCGGDHMPDHNALSVVFDATNTLVGGTPVATLVTAEEVPGNKTATLAASYAAKPKQCHEQNHQRESLREEVPSSARTSSQIRIAGPNLNPLWATHPLSWGSFLIKSLDSCFPVIHLNAFSPRSNLDMLAAVARKKQKAHSTRL